MARSRKISASLVSVPSDQLGLPGAPQLLQQFTIRPRYALRPRSSSRATSRSSACSPPSRPATASPPTCRRWPRPGLSCPGLDVVRRDPASVQRRLAGRIDRIAGEDVLLAESFDHLAGIPARQVTLEGSRDTFTACLRVMQGGRYNKFEAERQRLEPKLHRLGCFHCAGLGFYALAGMAGVYVMVRGMGAPIRSNARRWVGVGAASLSTGRLRPRRRRRPGCRRGRVRMT